jgi:hypothetical protein
VSERTLAHIDGVEAAALAQPLADGVDGVEAQRIAE